ncbi:hypothetical protein HDU86_006813 [Geranomyces michiganensis]|nr:hypothetical protein HDU86_006813 [Geranomyces michiganensis]
MSDSGHSSPADKRTYSMTDLPVSASASSLRSRIPSSLSVNNLPEDDRHMSAEVLPVPTVAGAVEAAKPPAFEWSIKAVLTEMLVLPLTMVISLFSYCPFCIAVVVQSTVTATAVDTDKWKDEMKGWAWLVGLGGFFGLLLYPTGVVKWMEHADGQTVGTVLGVFLFALFVVQGLTISYAFLKPGLGMVAIPADQKLNILTWRNILVLLAPFFEFMQFTSLAFKTVPDSWLCVSGFGNVVRVFTRTAGLKFANLTCKSNASAALGGDIQTPELMINSAMFAFALSLMYALLLGYAIAKLLQPGHWLCAIVFEVFAGIGYIPIVSRLMSLLACHSQTNADGTRTLYLMYAEADIPSEPIRCFTDGHKKYAAMAFAGLLLFGLSAIFMLTYLPMWVKADKHVRRSAVTFIPRLVVIRRMLNSTLLAINLLLAYAINDTKALAYATQGTGIAVLLALLTLDIRFNSCTFHEIRLLATGAHLAALWSYIITVLVSINHFPYSTTAILLITGWFVVAVGICATILYTNYSSRAVAIKSSQNLERGRMGADDTTEFRVVTMGRRMKVVVTLTPRNADGEVEDEDLVIAAAIYGGKQLDVEELHTLQRHLTSTVASARKRSMTPTLERPASRTTTTNGRQGSLNTPPTLIRKTELISDEEPMPVDSGNAGSGLRTSLTSMDAGIVQRRGSTSAVNALGAERRGSRRGSVSPPSARRNAPPLRGMASRVATMPSASDGTTTAPITRGVRSPSPDGADTSPMGQLAKERRQRPI